MRGQLRLVDSVWAGKLVPVTLQREHALQDPATPEQQRSAKAGAEEMKTGMLHGLRLDRFLARRIWLAGCLFKLEAILPVLLIAALGPLIFIAVALLQGWQQISPVFHIVALGLAVLWPVLCLYYFRRDYAGQDDTLVVNRLEKRLGLAHNPLQAQMDRLPDSFAKDREVVELWTAHHMALRQNMARLAFPRPQISWMRYDPWLMSVPVVLLLFVAAMYAGPASWARLAKATSINMNWQSGPQIAVEGWLDPPEWTGLSPIYLNQTPVVAIDADETATPVLPRIEVPENSRLMLRIDHSKDAPVLSGPGFVQDFTRESDGLWALSRDIEQGGVFRITTKDNKAISGWDFDLVLDRTPIIQFSELPRITGRQILRIRYEGRDDYGITDLSLILRKSNLDHDSEDFVLQPISWEIKAESEYYVLPVSLSGERDKDIAGNAWFDLTDHPWAGQEVELVLEVKDTAGKVGVSRSLRTTLPEKSFAHPVAEEIVELRKLLFLDNDYRDAVADGFDSLRQDPDSWNHDFLVQMSLALGASRLRDDGHGVTATPRMAELAWDTALWLEEGMAARAREKLAELQERLREAIENAAMDEEFARLLDELDQAWQQLREDRRQAMADMPPELRELLEQGDLSAQQFERVMEELRRLSEMGDTEALREMLSQLQDLTNMTPGNNLPSNERQQQMMQTMQMMQQLQDLVRDQQSLMDDTLRADQYPGTETRRREAGKLIPEQEDLIRRLRETMDQAEKELGGVPQSLQQADKAMRDAIQDMKDAKPNDAMADQAAAIEALSQGSNNMSAMMGMQGMMNMMGQGMNGGRRDPMGRPMPNGQSGPNFGGSPGDQQAIPAERSLREARKVWQELQRRLDDPNRDEQEIDYLERLLDRFTDQ